MSVHLELQIKLLEKERVELREEIIKLKLDKEALTKQLTLTDVGYPLCACGGNERIAMDCTRKRCEHPKYAKK